MTLREQIAIIIGDICFYKPLKKPTDSEREKVFKCADAILSLISS